jgi:hypothetical protein
MYKEATELFKIKSTSSPDLKAYFTVNSSIYGYMSDYALRPKKKKVCTDQEVSRFSLNYPSHTIKLI